jgi:hypothetical protein
MWGGVECELDFGKACNKANVILSPLNFMSVITTLCMVVHNHVICNEQYMFMFCCKTKIYVLLQGVEFKLGIRLV